MNATHESIVRRFRDGETVMNIGLSLGFSSRHVRQILREKDIVLPRRATRQRTFQSRPDGEYVECARCAKLGYGADAWHPATPEFWRPTYGRLYFGQCRACISEVLERKAGFVRIAA